MSVRPKPWEKNAGDSLVSLSQNTTNTHASSKLGPTGTPTASSEPAAQANLAGSSTSTSTGVPPLPERLAADNVLSSSLPTATGYSPYSGSYSGYGNYGTSYGGTYGSGYGTGFGTGYGSYSSPYNRYGTGMYGGGYGGGYGGSYGTYGSVGGLQDPNSFRGSLESSTTATFQLIESIVGAVGGFAQMLESTYMATHSSFFAMVSVAEQFGHLKNSLGSILGIFAILRWSRRFLAKITGKATNEITAKDFAKFSKKLNDSSSSASSSPRPRPSFKPLLVFAAAVFGLPYLLGKLIKAMAAQQESNLRRLNGGGSFVGKAIEPNQEGTIDPSKLEFCKALYDFVPENPHVELELHKGDLVAILSRQDIHGNPSQWWRARSRDGRMGYVPSTYVQVVKAQPRIKEDASIESTADTP